MKRRFLKLIATALNLWTLFTLALCIRSYYVGYTVSFQIHKDARYEITLNNGELAVDQSNPQIFIQAPLNQGWILWKYAKFPPVSVDWQAITAPDPLHRRRAFAFMHFGYFYWQNPGIPFFRAFAMPLWFAMALSGIPAIAAIRSYRRSMRIPGRCVTCGYDLRATPDRCPECGMSSNSK